MSVLGVAALQAREVGQITMAVAVENDEKCNLSCWHFECCPMDLSCQIAAT